MKKVKFNITKVELFQSDINSGSRLDLRTKQAKRLISGLNNTIPKWFALHPAKRYLSISELENIHRINSLN